MELSITLEDTMTLGALRTLANGLGKRLVITLANGEAGPAPMRRGRPPAAAGAPAVAEAPKGPRGRKFRRPRKPLSAEARAKLAKNLEKARAAQAAKRAKAR